MGADGDQDIWFSANFQSIVAKMRLPPGICLGPHRGGGGFQLSQLANVGSHHCRGPHRIAGPRAPRPHDPPLAYHLCKKLQQCRMFGHRCGKGKQQSKHCSRTKAEVSTPTADYFQPNLLRAQMHCCIWKHDDQATPPDIDKPCMGGREVLSIQLPPANTPVGSDPPDVHVLVPCCHVHYSEGAKVDWIVLMSTLTWQWKTYLMLKMEKSLITSISRFSSLTLNLNQ